MNCSFSEPRVRAPALSFPAGASPVSEEAQRYIHGGLGLCDGGVSFFLWAKIRRLSAESGRKFAGILLTHWKCAAFAGARPARLFVDVRFVSRA